MKKLFLIAAAACLTLPAYAASPEHGAQRPHIERQAQKHKAKTAKKRAAAKAKAKHHKQRQHPHH
ncbi:MAG: hypothetical protein Q3966_00310 [Neisseria sp.]|nr:hypothetical protein [Neisseria sp.]